LKGAHVFRYDSGGNLWFSGSTRWALDKLGRPVQQGPTSFTWDAAGSLTELGNLRNQAQNG
jgi:YD repeat-containing protein